MYDILVGMIWVRHVDPSGGAITATALRTHHTHTMVATARQVSEEARNGLLLRARIKRAN